MLLIKIFVFDYILHLILFVSLDSSCFNSYEIKKKINYSFTRYLYLKYLTQIGNFNKDAIDNAAGPIRIIRSIRI